MVSGEVEGEAGMKYKLSPKHSGEQRIYNDILKSSIFDIIFQLEAEFVSKYRLKPTAIYLNSDLRRGWYVECTLLGIPANVKQIDDMRIVWYFSNEIREEFCDSGLLFVTLVDNPGVLRCGL
jgi:hypothetical protein